MYQYYQNLVFLLESSEKIKIWIKLIKNTSFKNYIFLGADGLMDSASASALSYAVARVADWFGIQRSRLWERLADVRLE